VTNNFIRYGQNNQVVMTGDATVVKIQEGIYTVADLSKKWLDDNSSEGQPLRPEDIRIVKNVSDSLHLILSSQVLGSYTELDRQLLGSLAS
jgi:hypothetical protein